MDAYLRVLMLEYNASDAELLEHSLRTGGIRFVARRVQDRASFVSAFKDFMPDIVLADYSLPSFSGLKAVDYMRRHHSGIPVIIVTDTLNEETAVDCIKAGAWDYVLKNNMLRLVPAVKAALKLKESFDEKRKAEAVLQTSVREWLATFNAINDSVALLDLKGRIVRCNTAAEVLFNKKIEEITGRTSWELFEEGPDSPDIVPFERMLASGKRKSYVSKRRDRWFKVTLDPVLDRDGRVISVVQVHIDISDQKRFEKTIQDERDRAQTFLDIARAIILILDAEGNVKLINKKGCEILGCCESEIVGKNWFEHFVPERERVRVNAIFADIGEADIHEYEEYLVVTKNGEERLIAWHNARWTDEKNRFLGTISSGEDITERRKAEDQVRFLARFPSENPSPVLRVLAGGTIIFANEAGSPLLKEWGCGVGDALPERLAKIVSDAYRTGKKITCEIPSGNNIFSFIVTPVKEVNYVNLYGIDITHRLLAERDLARERNILRTLIDTLPDLVSIKDGDGRILLANKALSEYLGAKSPEAIIGRRDADFFQEEIASGFVSDDRYIFETGNSIINREETIVNRQGERRFVLTTKVPFMGDTTGRVTGVLVIVRDISEVKQVQEELEQMNTQLQQVQKMEAVGRLAGGIAHDFNNVLTAVIGYADYLLMKLGEGDGLKEYVREIKSAGMRAANLTHQLLAFSKRQAVQPKLLDLNAVICGIERMVRQLLGEDILIEMQLAPDLGMIKIDESQIEQVIVNLAVNARDAMPEGGQLSVRTCNAVLDESYCNKHAGVQPGSYVMLSVSDTGVGMDCETRRRVFEPFFTTKEIGRGTGLGLSTVYGIVKQNGGHIWLYSERGKGTVFKIYLPAVSAGCIVETEKPEVSGSLEGTESILLVEDEEMIRNICGELLETYGYRVVSTGDARTALKILEEGTERFDLLVADIVMPAMSGIELADAARAATPGLKVILISGFQEHVLFDSATRERLVFLEKPFAPIELVGKVRSVLDDRRESA